MRKSLDVLKWVWDDDGGGGKRVDVLLVGCVGWLVCF